jgi:urease accessory protein
MDEVSAPDFSWLARLLQVTDSAFPTGSYAHSYGFEEVVRFGRVHDFASMAHHIENHLWPMLVHFELPVVRFARQAALEEDFSALLDLAVDVDATKSAREMREASRATGSRRLHAFLANAATPILTSFARAVDENKAQPHHTIVFGIGLAPLPMPALLTSWAFQSVSAICLSAPKLLRIGQDSAQRVLSASLSRLEENVALSLAVDREEIGWFDPLLEIASMQHEIAPERLFIS